MGLFLGDSAMSKSIAQLFSEQNELLQKIINNDGEVTNEIESQLESLATLIPSKVDSYYAVLDRIENESVYFKTKADEFTAAQKSLMNVHYKIRERIKFLMQQEGINKLPGVDFQFSLSKTKPAVTINNLDLIPKEYSEIVQETKINKDMLREDLERGVPVPGASLVEGFALRSSVLKTTKLKGKSND